VKIGVISDTHIPSKARMIPEIVLNSFKGVDLIIHAGDIIQKKVLDILAQVAPVQAVSGNIDPQPLRETLPDTLEMELEGFKIAVIHGHKVRGHLMNTLGLMFPEADIIIFGHTHKPCNEIITGQLHFNPGSPTDKRWQKKHSFGIIELGDEIQAEIIEF